MQLTVPSWPFLPTPPRRALLDGVIRLSCRIDVQQDVRRVLGPVLPESHEAYRWAGLSCASQRLCIEERIWHRVKLVLGASGQAKPTCPALAANPASQTSLASRLCPPASLAHELYGTTRMLLAVLDRQQLAEVCVVSPS